jgi:putative membrane protein
MKHTLYKYWHANKELIAIGITAFFLLAGVVQYAFGLTYILQLTPLAIGVLAACVVLFWAAPPRRKAALVVFAFLLGMLVEIIGINTGLLFGEYSYGSALGLKIAGVPLLIGITWALVTVSAWQIVSYSVFGKLANVLLAACIVVVFDLVIEQYATAFGLWAWQDGIIPLKNYFTWFVVSLIISGVYARYSKQEKPSIYGAAALPLMAIFFWLMLVVR